MLKKINLVYYYLFVYPFYKLRFKNIGSKSRLIGLKIDGHHRISIGNKVFIRNGGWVACLPLKENTDATLLIDDGTYIGRYCHIYATEKIVIGKNVLIADKVYIADNIHSYDDISLPVIQQPVKQTNAVNIGDGAWLGENACIIGASVGRNSVIGANAVVTKDIPDYSVAVGAPAFIIKRYDTKSNQWLKTDKEGNFIE